MNRARKQPGDVNQRRGARGSKRRHAPQGWVARVALHARATARPQLVDWLQPPHGDDPSPGFNMGKTSRQRRPILHVTGMPADLLQPTGLRSAEEPTRGTTPPTDRVHGKIAGADQRLQNAETHCAVAAQHHNGKARQG